jgi:hypothetical protein
LFGLFKSSTKAVCISKMEVSPRFSLDSGFYSDENETNEDNYFKCYEKKETSLYLLILIILNSYFKYFNYLKS